MTYKSDPAECNKLKIVGKITQCYKFHVKPYESAIKVQVAFIAEKTGCRVKKGSKGLLFQGYIKSNSLVISGLFFLFFLTNKQKT